jgi:hypothetical protein
MIEEQPKRRQRNPLSAEELHYFIKLKQLKQTQKIETFKKSNFFKSFNMLNVLLVALLAYYICSVLFVCHWKNDTITHVSVSRSGPFHQANGQRSIAEVNLETTGEKNFTIKTDLFFTEPLPEQSISVGKDVVFGKILKVKFSNDDRLFWNINTYPSFSLSIMVLLLGMFIYAVNKHFTVNGLLIAFGLFFLANLYFICV